MIGMQICRVEIYEIIEKVIAGQELTAEDLQALYSVNPYAREAYYIRWAAHQTAMKASKGKAVIYMQIGLDASPCFRNCKFCSFAACNGTRKSRSELPVAKVVEYAKRAVDDGANAILLLTTAAYEFEKLLEVTNRLHEALGEEMPLHVGTDDYSVEQALAMKRTGVNGVYHSIRMGEGIDTTISVDTRVATIQNAHKAGLKHYTCLEPIGPEHGAEELAEKTLLSLNLNPVFGGAYRRVAVNGELACRGSLDDPHWSLYAAVYRLASGLKRPYSMSAFSVSLATSGANMCCTEVGPSPCDDGDLIENGDVGLNVKDALKIFGETGWEVVKGPAKEWGEEYKEENLQFSGR